jgi:hypothetical protein
MKNNTKVQKDKIQRKWVANIWKTDNSLRKQLERNTERIE